MKDKFNREFILEHRKEIIRYGAAVLAVLVILCFYVISDSKEEEELISQNQITSSEEEEQSVYTGEVIVDICGAVMDEQVVKLPAGSRIEDAIDAAGGLTDKADLTDINRAQILEDGEKIYIPSEGEKKKENKEKDASGVTSDGRVNINLATEEELETLDGIGPVTAGKIIQWRTEYGNFKTINDLMEVNGIGEKTFAQLKEKITV